MGFLSEPELEQRLKKLDFYRAELEQGSGKRAWAQTCWNSARLSSFAALRIINSNQHMESKSATEYEVQTTTHFYSYFSLVTIAFSQCSCWPDDFPLLKIYNFHCCNCVSSCWCHYHIVRLSYPLLKPTNLMEVKEENSAYTWSDPHSKLI